MSADVKRETVERHRDKLETIAKLDVDLEIVDRARSLLADVDGEGGERE